MPRNSPNPDNKLANVCCHIDKYRVNNVKTKGMF